MKLDKAFQERYHRRHGLIERIDYVFTRAVTLDGKRYKQGAVFFSVEKSKEGGWSFLGRHFNSIQGAKKEARRYCNQAATRLDADS